MGSSLRVEPQVAFIIPARNEAQYLPAALDSVVAQRFPLGRLEVVVAENGSSDDTAGVAAAYAARTPALALRVLRDPLAGIARAKNRGAREAIAPTLIFLDADSRAADGLAAKVVAWVNRGFPAGSIRIVADSTDWLDRGFFGLIEWGKGLFNIHAQMLFCARDVFLRAGGFGEEFQLAEDREFLTRLERDGVPVCHVRDSFIATSPRRLRSLPFRLGVVTMFARWTLAQAHIGRRWPY